MYKLAFNPALTLIVASKIAESVLPRANYGEAPTNLPKRQGFPGVSRSHLPYAIRPYAWSFEKRDTGALAAYPKHASLAQLHPEAPYS